MASPHLAEQVGRVLDGRYRVVAPIGTGASAAVYLADDTVLRRRVALKVLHAALAGDQGFLKRFQAEAHTAAALSHPNIMRVLDWGEGDEGPFLVLEYLGGGSLRGVLDDMSTLSVSQALQVGIQAARALDYAHRRGLVHRDVKPANLLFDEDGRLAIADFGLARALAEAAWTEPGGAVLGTARYASPEQVRGQSLDGKADVYALGLVLFEAVMGYVPFTADTTIATLMARLDAHLEVPDDLGVLGPIVKAATHPDPMERLDAAHLLSMLESAAATVGSPERLTLPGAIAVNLTSMAGPDPTMLRATGENVAVSVEARPLPEDLQPKPRRRSLLRGKKDETKLKTDGPAPLKQPVVKTRRKRRVPVAKLLVGLLLVVLLSGGAAGGYALYYSTGAEREVPTLVGMKADVARQIAAEGKIKVSIDGPVYDELVPVGDTFEQSPAAGQKVHAREVVHVKVSRGPAPRPVPNVIGQTLEDAKRSMSDKSFTVSTEDKSDEVKPKGQVLDQRPKNGELDKGSEVHLVVSSGPRPRIVPDVKGLTQDEAQAKVAAEGLRVNVTQDFSDDVPVGKVIGTNPGPKASAQRDSTVNVIVSKGPNLVTVPSVIGDSFAAAKTAIEKAGFKFSPFGPQGTPVFSTKPAAGAVVKAGTEVLVYFG